MTLYPTHFLEKIDPKDRKRMGKSGLTQKEIEAKIEYKNEAELQEQIRSLLVQYGVKFIVRQPMNKKSNLIPGTPDFLFVYLGTPVAIEAKTLTGTLSPDQRALLPYIYQDGWTVLIARKLEEVRELMDGILHRHNQPPKLI